MKLQLKWKFKLLSENTQIQQQQETQKTQETQKH